MSLNIELIRQSFAKAAPISDQVADKFYEHLFRDYPEVKVLFDEKRMPGQKKALMKSLSYIVDNFDNPDKLHEYLREMGKRHVKYGTIEEHYPAVGNSLIKTLAHFFGDEWTPELEEEWGKAYNAIVTLMLEGASYVEPTEDVIRKRARLHANNLLLNSLEEELGSDILHEKIRSRLRKVIFEVLEEEYENILGSKKGGRNAA